MKNEASSARSFKFPKSERLQSKLLIDKLFQESQSFFIYPFKVLYLISIDGSFNSNQVLITASSKRFKRAVDRNLIKRRIKEAYRLNKHILTDNTAKEIKLLIGYIYVGKEIHNYELIESKLKQSLHRLNSESSKRSENG